MFRFFASKQHAAHGSHNDGYKISPPKLITILDEPHSLKTSSIPSTITQHTDYANVARISAVSWDKPSRQADYEIPHLVKTPWELERRSRKSVWSSRPSHEKEVPTYTLKALPREVHDCIVSQLEEIHLGGDQACPPCYLRDLHSLTLTSRAWERAARPQLYRNVHVLASDEHSRLPRLKIRGASRLKLLRRTLRQRGPLARSVRELHLSDFHTLYQEASIEREEILNLVASLVMACPLLERVVGFHVPFTQSFDRFSYALATRPYLKERVWLLSEPESDDADDDDAPHHGHYVEAIDPTERFLEHNSRHPDLTTLVLHQESKPATVSLNFRAIVGTFRQYPALKHLTVSGLPATSFTNMTLNALPSNLQSLRLDNLPGVNDKGLQRFMASNSAISIEKLTLVNLEVASLITLSSILSEHLSSLKEFTLIQHQAPSITSRATIPDFNSPTLQYLHFELRSQAGPMPTASSDFTRTPAEHTPFPFTNPEPISCLATSLLATSILDSAFPSLRRICVPHDPQGVIQSLCKPLATALSPTDTTTLAIFSPSPTTATKPQTYSPTSTRSFSLTSHPCSRADSAIGSPTSSHASPVSPACLTPARSRAAAQSRIAAARHSPRFKLRVCDPDGELVVDTSFAGYIGIVDSPITYVLRPHRERAPCDEGGEVRRSEWVVGVEDLVGERAVSRARDWGTCGHPLGVKGGGDVVRVSELF